LGGWVESQELKKVWPPTETMTSRRTTTRLHLNDYTFASERLHVCCIRVINLCHRVPTQLQLN